MNRCSSRSRYVPDALRAGTAPATLVLLAAAMTAPAARAATPDDQVIFHENFEGEFPAGTWSVGDDDPANGEDHWDKVTCRSHYGAGSAWCMGSATSDCGTYKGEMDTYMKLLPEIDLDGYANPQLVYRVWYDLPVPPAYAGTFRLYTLGEGDGGVWQHIDSEALWYGESGVWVERRVDLPYTDFVRIRFRFKTNETPPYHAEGVYVDDIEIIGCPVLGPTTLVSPGSSAFVCADYSQPYCWNPVDRASSYRIQWLTVDTVPTVFAEGVATGTCYWKSISGTGARFWRVRAESSCSEGAWSEMRFLLLADRPAEAVPAAPAPGQEVCAGVSQRFEWSPVGGALDYTIQWDTSNAFPSPDEEVVTTPYADRAFALSARRYWRVAAGNGYCNGPWSTARVFYVINAPGQVALLDPPDDVGVCSGVARTYQWQADSDATGYTIHWATSPGFSSPIKQDVAGASVERTLTGLGPWYWRVAANNTCGAGLWSETRSLYLNVVPTAPVLLGPNDGASVCSERIQEYCWSSTPGAGTYRFEWDDDPAFGTPVEETQTADTCLEFARVRDGLWNWHVRAEGPCGASDWSQARTVLFVGEPFTFSCTAVSALPGGGMSLAWDDPGCPMLYTVEYHTAPGDPTGWLLVEPADQWPITETTWSGAVPAGPDALYLRVRGE